jgi:hypothetical protein
MCPGRILPTSFQAFGNESEWLVLGFILPEEIVKVYGEEGRARFRQGLTDEKKMLQAEELTNLLDLPAIKEPELAKCSTNSIGLQSSPDIKMYVQLQTNKFVN